MEYIWNCNIPPKVSIFLWQACSSSLPTKDKLLAKRVNCDDKCHLCVNGKETIDHLFVECEFARNCWRCMGILNQHATGINFQEWLVNTTSNMSNDQTCTIILACWNIWNLRNNILWHNKAIESPVTLIRRTQYYLSD